MVEMKNTILFLFFIVGTEFALGNSNEGYAIEPLRWYFRYLKENEIQTEQVINLMCIVWWNINYRKISNNQGLRRELLQFLRHSKRVHK